MDKWSAVDQLMASKGLKDDEIPSHAFTREEFQERFGLNRSGAEARLRVASEAGEVVSGFKRIRRGRRNSWVRFYWVPEPAPKRRSKAA